MANILNDTFESGGFAAWTANVNVVAATGIAGMTGIYCADFTSGTDQARLSKDLSPALTEIWLAFLLKAKVSAGNNGSILVFSNGATILGMLEATSTGTSVYQLKIYSGDWGTLLDTYAVDLDQGTVYSIAVRYQPHASAGVFQVKVNDALVIDFSGTTAPSTLTMDAVRLGEDDSDCFYFYADNVAIDDADWPSTVAPYYHTVTGGIKVSGDNATVFNRTVFIFDRDDEVPASADINITGNNTPVFIIPGAYLVTVTEGIEIGGFNLPLFVTPGTYRPSVGGGALVGGRPVPVFYNPDEFVGIHSYLHSVWGGVNVSGSPAISYITPGTYLHTVSGGVRVTGPLVSGAQFVQPVTPITTSGGMTVGGRPVPVFVDPTSATYLFTWIPSGGVKVTGNQAPSFSTPGTYLATASGGVQISNPALPVPTFGSPVTHVYVHPVHGGVQAGGNPTPVFYNPDTAPTLGLAYLWTPVGGLAVSGGSTLHTVTPASYLATVMGGVRISSPATSTVLFVQPIAAPNLFLVAGGGIDVGGETTPTFSKPKSYSVPIDPRIIAAINVGGGGSAIFIAPQVYLVSQPEGEIILGDSPESVATDEVFETWVLNGKNYEPSIFSGWQFNSFAVYRGQVYGATEDGLFVLEGADDDGVKIRPGVQIGPINFGTNRYKRLRVLHLGVCGDEVQVGVKADNLTRYFAVEDEGRVPVSTDLEGKVITIDISDFETLSQTEIYPLTLARR